MYGNNTKPLSWRTVLILATMMMAIITPVWAESPKIEGGSPNSFDQVVERISAREAENVKNLKQYSPLVETYIQDLRPDKEMGWVPTKDDYFLGKLDFTRGVFGEKSLLKQAGFGTRMLKKLTSLYSMDFLPLGFAQMIIPDGRGLDRSHYQFNFVRREFLGDLRCLVIDVTPKKNSGTGRFQGRIWVEDQDYNIVRFNGTFAPAPWRERYLHFDSWRLNMQPGLWLPAYVYSEETELNYKVARKLHYKAQTRLWGYDLTRAGRHEEFSTVLVDSDSGVQDKSEKAQDATPVQAERQWELMAEQNVLDRLEKAGLLAPEGEVDKVLTQVVNNIEITNNLDIQPPVRARVMLTSPLESFTIGHTIVLSRGLIDVLPDEPTLAMVVAHEMSHILLGHKFDTKYAFNDRMQFPDEAAMQKVNFHRDTREETEADQKALSLLQNSPYRDKLQSAGLFLKSLQTRKGELPNLIHAHLGNGMFNGGNLRMAQLETGAPKLEPRRLDQIASLPLGGRVHVNPWDDHIELTKAKAVALLSPKEKMPFEVTPVYPYLSRSSVEPREKLTAGNVR